MIPPDLSLEAPLRFRPLSLSRRLLAAFLFLLMLVSPSQPVIALTLEAAGKPAAGTAAGKAAAAHLNNAGAASVVLAARQTRQGMAQTAAVTSAVKTAQTAAQTAARVAAVKVAAQTAAVTAQTAARVAAAAASAKTAAAAATAGATAGVRAASVAAAARPGLHLPTAPNPSVTLASGAGVASAKSGLVLPPAPKLAAPVTVPVAGVTAAAIPVAHAPVPVAASTTVSGAVTAEITTLSAVQPASAVTAALRVAPVVSKPAASLPAGIVSAGAKSGLVLPTPAQPSSLTPTLAQIPSATVPSSPSLPSLPEVVTELPSAPAVASPSSVSAPIAAEVSSSLPRVAGAKVSAPPAQTLSALSSVAPAAATPVSSLLSATPSASSLTPTTPQQQAVLSETTVSTATKSQTEAASSATGLLPDGSAVPNGLVSGGLEPEGVSLAGILSPGSLEIPASWKGVKSLYQTTTASGKTIIDIIQSPDAQFSYLNWSSFNLGAETVLNILQNTSLLTPVGPVASGQSTIALASVKGLFKGQGLIGGGITGGTKITKVDQTAGTITLSHPLTDPLGITSILGAILENAGTYASFNSVNEGSVSHLFGAINASGQFYLLNQSGVAFHAGSSATARGLVVSTLPINENLAGSYRYNAAYGGYTATVGRGLANNPDSQFLFSALPVSGNGNLKTVGFTPVLNGPVGDVVVERGVRFFSPVDENGSGGKVALIGANVVNGGSVSTPAGQTILAAGLQVALTPHNSSDPSLRGLDVTIGRVEDPEGSVTIASGTAGAVTHEGMISVPTGSAALAGSSVSTGEGSVVDGLTTTGLNGRIDIAALYNAVANDQFPNTGRALVYENGENSGTIAIGEGSLLRILPDWNDTETKVVGSALALNSQMTLSGSSIGLGDGSLLLAPGAVATPGALTMAGESLAQGVLLRAGSYFDAGGGNSRFIADRGSVSVGSGAGIILSGSSEVAAPSTEYMITLQLRGPELADSPLLQNNKEIRAKDLVVDTRYTGTLNGNSWVGTPLGNIAGYLNLVTRNVGELTTAGGTLAIQAGSSVEIGSGALLDVSGGSVRYSGGTFSPSQVITAAGEILPLYFARPDITYTGLVKNPAKVTEAPYSQGSAGGSIAISAPEIALDGSLRGITTAGPRQISSLTSVSFKSGPSLSETTSLPAPSSLSIALSGQQVFENLVNTVSAPSPVAVRFGSPSSASQGELVLDPGLLSRQGFRNFTLVNHDGGITVSSGVTLDAGANGSVRLEGATLAVNGAISAPSGEISLSAPAVPYALANTLLTLFQESSFLAVVISKADGQPYYQYGPVHEDGSIDAVGTDGATVVTFASDEYTVSDSGSIRIGSGARISTAGTLTDGRLRSSSPILTQGGDISLNALNLAVLPGSQLDVSSGAFLGSSGKWVTGAGGNLSLLGGQSGSFHDGTLVLGGTLLGYASPGQKGGSLTLGAQAFQIGDVSSPAILTEGDTSVILSSVKGFAIGQRITGRGIDPGTIVEDIDAEGGTITLSQPATASLSSVKLSADYGSRSLKIDPQAYYGNGFSSLSLQAIGLETSYGAGLADGDSLPGITVTPGTVIAPVIASRIPLLSAGGGVGYGVNLPSQLGYAPSLSLSVSGFSDGSLPFPLQIIGRAEIGEGVSILLNPELTFLPALNAQKWTSPSAVAGAFSLSAPTVVVAGKVSVPGGSIRISGRSSYPSDETLSAPLVTADLTPTAFLSARGVSVAVNDATGVYGSIGTVLPGGSVSLLGDFLAEPGSVIDVSGASAVLGMPGAAAGTTEAISRVRVDSAGGSVTLSGGDSFVMAGILLGLPGGQTASGGSLRFSISAPITPIDPALLVTQQAPDVEGLGLSGTGSGPLGSHLGEESPFGGNLGIDTFAPGGFSDVTLLGNTAFTGRINLSVNGSLALAASPAITRDPLSGFVNRPNQGGVITADSLVKIAAGNLSLGMAFAGPLVEGDPFSVGVFDQSAMLPPTPGEGELQLKARHIDIGNLSLQSISTTALTTTRGGMIRGDGNFVVSGALKMSAGVIAPESSTQFSITAFPTDDSGSLESLGSITTVQNGLPSLPWSVGGRLDLYASSIIHGGTISAPHGTILLGRSSGSAEVINPIAGADVLTPVAQSITLASGSTISVSGIDPKTGKEVILPYGISSDGTSWKDPAGIDITGRGIAAKRVTVDADSVSTVIGSTIDLRGGGEIVASQWIGGLGGTVHYSDNDSGNYAIIPEYSASAAPSGLPVGGISVGTRIHLTGGGGLPAGDYTLLPASYADLPGAYLLSPSRSQGIAPPGGLANFDGTVNITGSIYNGFSSDSSSVVQTFTLYSPSVLSSFQEVKLLKSSTFFSALPGSPRTADGGSLLLNGTRSMELNGGVRGKGGPGGSGAVIAISSSAPFLITGSSGPSSEPVPGSILLDASVLSAFDSSSLLIGGTRVSEGLITRLKPISSSVTVDSGAVLGGQQEFLFAATPQSYTTTGGDETPSTFASQYSFSPEDLIAANIHAFAEALGVSEAELTANPSDYIDSALPEGTTFRSPGASLVIAPGATVSVSGTAPSRSYAVSGDGAIALVSAGTSVSLARSGFTVSLPSLQASVPLVSLSVGEGSSLTGASVILDSSGISTIDPALALKSSSVSLSAGALSAGAGAVEPGALSLSGALLANLNASDRLSLTSYSTLTLHDGAELGSARLASLSLHAAAIAGDGGNASVTVSPTGTLLLDNASGSSLPAEYAPVSPAGTLSLAGGVIALGGGSLRIDGFEAAEASAAQGVSFSGIGGVDLGTGGTDLRITAPVITAAGGARYDLRAGGSLALLSSGADPGVLQPGLGGILSLSGNGVTVDSAVKLPSGNLTISSSGDLTLTSRIDLSGRTVPLNGHPAATSGGSLRLSSSGNLTLAPSAAIDLSAPTAGGDAGSLSFSVPSGLLTLGGTLLATAPKGSSGSFTADLMSVDPSGSSATFAAIEDYLGNASGGFTRSQSFRIRNGDVILPSVKASSFRLGADSGALTVSGTVDASGVTGGTISLFSGGNLTLASGSRLNASGTRVDAAGKGGAIDLESVNGTVDLRSGSVIDLSLASAPSSWLGQSPGSLTISAPQLFGSDGLPTGVSIAPVGSTILGRPSLTAVASATYDAASSDPASLDAIPVWGSAGDAAYPTGLAYAMGEQVIGNDGNVYRLTSDKEAYAQYVSTQVAGGAGTDPADSYVAGDGFWTLALQSWGNLSGAEEGSLEAGTKVIDQPGRAGDGSPTGPSYVYTALHPVDLTASPAAPSDDPANWVILPESGNLQYLALANASSALFNSGYADALSSFASPSLGSQVSSLHLQPGERLQNSLGGLILNSSWDLSTTRSGSSLELSGGSASVGTEPGRLTLRAAKDILFRGSLSDGFGDSLTTATQLTGLYSRTLLPLLRDGVTAVSQRSWGYRISAGADMASADASISSTTASGSVILGIPGQPWTATQPGQNASTPQVLTQLNNQYQVIRTGTGEITLSSSGDIRLLSPLASIYTAGMRIADPTAITDASGNTVGFFDLPTPNLSSQYQVGMTDNQQPSGAYESQYSSGGGNVTLESRGSILRENAILDEDGNYTYAADGGLVKGADSSLEMPSNWLHRRGSVDTKTGLFQQIAETGNDIASTAWWVDFSNFYNDVAALGGGHVRITADGDIANLSASIPTNLRMAGRDALGRLITASSAPSVELGGGDLSVRAGGNIDGGVYYVERGNGEISAAGSIITNPTRDPAQPLLNGYEASSEAAWLPTTLYLGKGNFSVNAGDSVRLGPVANAFLTAPGINNSFWYKTYFSTYAPGDTVSVKALSGNVVIATQGATYAPQLPGQYAEPLLQLWFQQGLPAVNENAPTASYFQPWLSTSELNNTVSLGTMMSLMPPTLSATAFGGDITLQGNVTLAPSATGNLSLTAAKGISGLANAGKFATGDVENPEIYPVWLSSVVNLSDASPSLIPSLTSPLSLRSSLPPGDQSSATANGYPLGANYISDGVAALFAESGSFSGANSLLAHKLSLHDPTLLHAGDTVPLLLNAASGDISGLTLFSPKVSEIRAGGGIADVGLYLQNLSASDISTVTARGDIRLYDPASSLRVNASTYNAIGNADLVQSAFPSGDIQISGPGTLEVLAGGSVDLGNAPSLSGDSTIWNGITSIGNSRNPGLAFQGADVVVSAGLLLPGGLTGGGLDAARIFAAADGLAPLPGKGGLYKELIDSLEASGQSSLARWLTDAGSLAAAGSDNGVDADDKSLAALRLFYLALRDSGRAHNDPAASDRTYAGADAVIAAFLNRDALATAGISAWQRSIATGNGGDISLLAPRGGISLSAISTGESGTPPGIITKHGGSIGIYTSGDVSLGIGRIFTLRGGNIMIWSDKGSIAAGSSAKTVASAPPASILIDPASGDVQNDLAGLSTGGGIGVLATVEGVPPGDVDLYARSGVIDAGDAGIRASGNFFAGATKFLNADNLQISGRSVGAPAAPTSRAAAAPASAPSAPAAAPASAPANASAAANRSSADTASKSAAQKPADDDTPSIYAIDVLGYGGSDKEDEDENAKKSASL